jgi:hypothetical protein
LDFEDHLSLASDKQPTALLERKGIYTAVFFPPEHLLTGGKDSLGTSTLTDRIQSMASSCCFYNCFHEWVTTSLKFFDAQGEFKLFVTLLLFKKNKLSNQQYLILSKKIVKLLKRYVITTYEN